MKRAQPEYTLHLQVGAFLNLALPDDATWFHPPNAPRSAIQGARLKRMGMVAGMPDIGILHCGKAYWIELKADKGRLSEAQGQCHARLWKAGCPVALARSVDDVTLALERWGIPLKARVQ